jgi:hypothetical protein
LAKHALDDHILGADNVCVRCTEWIGDPRWNEVHLRLGNVSHRPVQNLASIADDPAK